MLIYVEHHIGMKKGVIPIYIAVVLTKIKNNIVIMCNGNETKLTADLLNSINEKPECYTVMMEDWNEDKTNYLNALENIFSDYLNESDKNFNVFAYIFNAINRWYLSLPKCAREMTVDYSTNDKISKQNVKFVNSLKNQIVNYRKYLMEELPSILGYSVINAELIESVKEIKDIYDFAKKNLINYLISVTIEEFGGKMGASLNSTLSEWYERLKDITIQNMFAGNENYLLKLISSITNDEASFIEDFAKALSGLRINDWDSNTYKTFKTDLMNFKDKIEEFDANTDESASASGNTRYSIGFIDDNGKETIRSFEKVEYSQRAKLLYNDITGAIEDMGQSITENEKRQVVLDILEKLCN